MSKILFLLKYYLFPIIQWGFTQAEKESFNLEVLYRKVGDNKSVLKKKLVKYSYDRTKALLKEWDKTVEDSVKTIPGYAGTLDDSEDYGGASGIKVYTGQELPVIKYNVEQYNQRDNIYNSPVLCFGYGNLGEASDNLCFRWTDDELKKADKGFVNSRNYDPKFGGYFSEGRRVTDNMLDIRGEEYDTYQTSSASKYVRVILDAGYSLTIGIRLTDKIIKGLKDGRLSNTEVQGGNRKYNHLVRIKKNKEGTVDIWIDNYYGILKFNTVEIEDISVLAKNGRLMNFSYFVVPKGKTLERIQGTSKIEEGKKSDYQKYLDRGFIEKPQPERVLTEELYGTFRERELRELD